MRYIVLCFFFFLFYIAFADINDQCMYWHIANNYGGFRLFALDIYLVNFIKKKKTEN